MVKLIITDMDGTLLDDNNNINEEFWNIEKELNKKGSSLLLQVEDSTTIFFHRFSPIKDDMLFIAEMVTYVMYKMKSCT
mgnify:CR=1 FL=1